MKNNIFEFSDIKFMLSETLETSTKWVTCIFFRIFYLEKRFNFDQVLHYLVINTLLIHLYSQVNLQLLYPKQCMYIGAEEEVHLPQLKCTYLYVLRALL